MSQLFDLLKHVLNGVANERLRTNNLVQTPALSTTQAPLSNLATEGEQDDKDEVAFSTEILSDFLDFELKLPLTSGGIHDVEARNPDTSSIGPKKVKELLSFVSSKIGASSPIDRSRSPEELDEVEYDGARSYSEYVIRTGLPDIRLREALRPSSLLDLSSWVAALTGFNTSVEQHHEEEESAMAGAYLGNDTINSSNSRTREGCHETLYEFLNDRKKCMAPDHLAYLRLPVSDGATFDMFLSTCSEAKAQQPDGHWHESSFTFEIQGPRYNRDRDLDICEEIRSHRNNRCRLCLSFNKSTIWPRSESSEAIRPFLRNPRLVTLSERLSQYSLGDKRSDSYLPKFRLALRLASSLQHLYPGPWIQRNWDTHLVSLVDEQDANTIQDLGQACIPCEFVRDWKVTNPVWQEFCGMQSDPRTDYHKFFLSFAQLLVDISEGGSEEQPPETNKDWWELLYDKTEETAKNKLLVWYGEAIKGCLRYALRYRSEGWQIENPRERAQVVIQRTIVENLQRNLQLWEEGWRTSDGQSAGPMPQPDTTAVWQPSAAPNPYFKLFADDEKHAGSEPENAKNEFLTRMKEFILHFLPGPGPLSPSKPVRIAVLDTGLRIDDSDIILRSGDKRVRADLSRNFLGAEGEGGDYLDVHGHGTHVARLLLRFAPHAEIVVLKISNSTSLKFTDLPQIAEALRWAVEKADADIINLSFGFDDTAKRYINPTIDRLVLDGRLIFAAASNGGGNGRRVYPANQDGVFAIHATRGDGSTPDNLNPPRDEIKDNFATFGYQVPSRWGGREVFVSGTSFATPVAAAIAANVLEFVRRTPENFGSRNPRHFSNYAGMRSLLAHMASRKGDYDYIRPWADGMFRAEQNTAEALWEVLGRMSAVGRCMKNACHLCR